jgi:hypothetical protein
LDVKAADSLIGELLGAGEPGLGQAAQSLIHSGVSMLSELKQFEGVEVTGDRTDWVVQVFVHCGAVGTQEDTVVQINERDGKLTAISTAAV